MSIAPVSAPATVSAPTLAHAPGAPFQIGLQAVSTDDWITLDARSGAQLRAKAQLLAERPGDIVRARDNSRAAQEEVLSLLADHLCERHCAHYVRDGTTVHARDADVRVSTASCDEGEPDVAPGGGTRGTSPARLADDLVHRDPLPLVRAARLVPDDLVIMRASPQGHRLVAAVLAFPSSWRLAEKFNQPMATIHAPVPGFADGTRNARMIERIFANLQPDVPAERFNWSLNRSGALYHPHSDHAEDAALFDQAEPAAWLRVERQTLRRLETPGCILFTIGVSVDPLVAIARDPNGPAHARRLAVQIDAMDDAEAAYKGLTASRHAVASWLRDVAAG
ncbi:MAG: DUF3445 domain-containing protein [Pseudomonadota bacterium]